MLKKTSLFLLISIMSLLLFSCGAKKPSAGKIYKSSAKVSYYHNKFNGRKTANGERFSNSKLTAAHRKLDFGTKVRLTNKINGKSVIVVINDRGPWKRGRELDISKKAFMEITDNKDKGILVVMIEIL